MGNRVYRPYHARFAAAAMRARIANENSSNTNEIHISKVLYDTGNASNLLSLSELKSTGKGKSIERSHFIHKDSVKLTKDQETGLYGLSFLLSSKNDLDVSVFYFVKEIIDTKTKSMFLSLDKEKSPSPITLKVPKGQSQEICIAPTLDLTKFNEQDLRFIDLRTYPIVIFAKSGSESVLLYCKVDSLNVVKVRESCSIGEKNYEILDLFGKVFGECVACLMEGPLKMLIPCRHFCLCNRCFENVAKMNKKCPICREFITVGYSLSG